MQKQILIVQEDTITTGYKLELEQIGYNVVDIVLSSEDALKIIEVHPINIIFIDISLKRKLQTAKTIIKKYPSIFIIFISAFYNYEILKEISSIPYSIFLSKPPNFSYFRKILNFV